MDIMSFHLSIISVCLIILLWLNWCTGFLSVMQLTSTAKSWQLTCRRTPQLFRPSYTGVLCGEPERFPTLRPWHVLLWGPECFGAHIFRDDQCNRRVSRLSDFFCRRTRCVDRDQNWVLLRSECSASWGVNCQHSAFNFYGGIS